MSHRQSAMLRRGRTLKAAVLSALLISPFAQAQQDSEHQRDYLSAIDKVAQAESRLLAEMQRIESGQVAHYDFLQFEHLEMIRHARALAWPPAGLDESARAQVATQAQQALDDALALEWVLADYLRAVALVRSASANTLDLLASAAVTDTAAAQQLKQALQALSGADYTTTGERVAAAYTDVTSQLDDAELIESLQFQARLLARGLPPMQRGREALASSVAEENAARIRAVVTSAP